MTPKSLLDSGHYSADWIRDFYDQTGIWWGPDSEAPQRDLFRAAAIERLCGPGLKRVLELGCGAGSMETYSYLVQLIPEEAASAE